MGTAASKIASHARPPPAVRDERPGPFASKYAVLAPIASGGMATIHVGRMVGAEGFSRRVAIKKLHAQYAHDPGFVAMLVDEGRVAARVIHPNVVSVLDVVRTPDDLFLVMDYVEGVPLSFLLDAARARGQTIPVAIASAIVVGVLHGLHAAHEATDEAGAPLGLVHRDVSPHNVLLSADGVPKVVDFGIAKARGRAQETTQEGHIKGKVPYMAPEQLRAADVDRAVDLWAAGIVLWETLVGARPFRGDQSQILGQILHDRPPSARAARPEIDAALEAVIARALARFPEQRFATAREMAAALAEAAPPASPLEVGAWVEDLARDEMARRATLVRDASARVAPPPESATQISSTTFHSTVAAVRRNAVLASVLGTLAVTGAGWIAASSWTRPAAEPARGSLTVDPAPPPPSAPSDLPVASGAPSASAPPLPKKAHPSRAKPASKTPPPGDARCYTLDAEGIWHIRPECL